MSHLFKEELQLNLHILIYKKRKYNLLMILITILREQLKEIKQIL